MSLWTYTTSLLRPQNHCEGKQSHYGGTPNHCEATEIIVNFTKSHYKGYTKSYLSIQKMIVKVIQNHYEVTQGHGEDNKIIVRFIQSHCEATHTQSLWRHIEYEGTEIIISTKDVIANITENDCEHSNESLWGAQSRFMDLKESSWRP